MSALVLIVEDEEELASTLAYNLEREGFETRTAFDGAVALEMIRQGPRPDLILLDIMLPGVSGIEVCKRLKADPETAQIPVIIQSARGDEIDRVVGFEIGADDYVVKPYSMRELVLRVRALRRRSHARTQEQANQVSFGPLQVDLIRHQVWFHDREIPLTALEFRLLTTLLTRKGRVQTRRALLDDVWGLHGDAETRTVDTHIKRLRQKLGQAGEFIETLRGVGYRFRTKVEDLSALGLSREIAQVDGLESDDERPGERDADDMREDVDASAGEGPGVQGA